MKLAAKWQALIVFTIVFLALMYFTFPQNEQGRNTVAQANTQNTSSDVAQEAPSAPLFTLTDLQGKNVSLADYRGKLVFVNFWATWCPPCRKEIPSFVNLVNKYEDDGFVILGISVDDARDFEKIPGFAESYSINYPILYGNAKVARDYGGVESIPTTFVIDQQGRALGKIVGARSEQEFEDIIKQFI